MPIDLQTTVTAVETIMVFTILYGENFFFKLGLGLLLGSTLGYGACDAANNIVTRDLVPITQGNLSPIIPVILGILLFASFFRKIGWISRYPSAIMIGTVSGSACAGILITWVYTQILACAQLTTLTQVFIAIWTVLILIYFFQTVENKRPLSYLTGAGNWALMLFFGAGLGVYVASRLSTLVGRVQFLLITWLGL